MRDVHGADAQRSAHTCVFDRGLGQSWRSVRTPRGKRRRRFGDRSRIVKVAEVGEAVRGRGRPRVGTRDWGVIHWETGASAILLIMGWEGKRIHQVSDAIVRRQGTRDLAYKGASC